MNIQIIFLSIFDGNMIEFVYVIILLSFCHYANSEYIQI